MQVEVHETAQQAAFSASEHIRRALLNDLDLVMGLATGGTMVPVYAALTFAAGPIFERATCFALDEYVGLPLHHPASYHTYLHKHLVSQIDPPPAAMNIPRGDAADLHAECARYEAQIHDAGGIGMQLLGIGANGHIGFNEPGAGFDTRTRLVELAPQTRSANARFFENVGEVPTHAVTMGIATIRSARTCLLVATGEGKAEAVGRLVNGAAGIDYPATALQDHPSLRVVLDTKAASQVRC